MTDEKKPRLKVGMRVYHKKLPGREFTIIYENRDGTFDLMLPEDWYFVHPEDITPIEDQDD